MLNKNDMNIYRWQRWKNHKGSFKIVEVRDCIILNSSLRYSTIVLSSGKRGPINALAINGLLYLGLQRNLQSYFDIESERWSTALYL